MAKDEARFLEGRQLKRDDPSLVSEAVRSSRSRHPSSRLMMTPSERVETNKETNDRNMKTKIDNQNLEPYVGNQAELYCQVGVVCSVTGTLLNGCGLCRWGVRMSNGQDIGFSFGQFKVLPNKTVSIYIS